MTKSALKIAVVTAAFCVSGSLLHAQKEHGGGAPSAGGDRGMTRGMTSAPGHASMPQGQGRSVNRAGEKPDASQGKRNGPDSTQTQKTPPGQQSSSDQLASNPKLSSKLQGFFPPSTNLSTAAAGFKSMGDFVAAAHVADNLGIPFDQLKGKIVGGETLGQAIHELKPDVDSRAEASRAQNQARKTLHDSGM